MNRLSVIMSRLSVILSPDKIGTKNLYYWLALLIVLTDQITKFIVRKNLILGDSIYVLPFFYITHIENTGIAFGMFHGNNLLFIIVSLIIIAFIFTNRKQIISCGNNLTKISILLILCGAIGNLIDRVVRGKITDFLDFGISYQRFPAFNVADSCITIGGILLCISFLTARKLGTP